jgi:hypothetical protein
MSASDSHEVSVAEEIADTRVGKPHVVLLGAGASRAAIPNGDKNGVPVPLLRDVASALHLERFFPTDLRARASEDFEAAYSKLASRGEPTTAIDDEVRGYFEKLELPDRPTLYDALNLSLRGKDAIFTFNWDPFLLQSRLRLANLGGIPSFPRLYFLHGNVMAGFCRNDQNSGLVGRTCSYCGEPFAPSRLLFPIEKKNYQDGSLIEREWDAVREYLKHAFMLTVFGYSAPKTDVEAIELLKEGWGEVADRNMEQTEIISRPGSDEDALRETWKPFIHTHHYEVHTSFYESWLGNHPRRSGEAYMNQYWEAKFIEDNPIPSNAADLQELTDWFAPLFEAERNAGPA